MKNEVLMVVLAFVAMMIITASSFNRVSAQSESFIERMNAYGSTVINIAGHPMF